MTDMCMKTTFLRLFQLVIILAPVVAMFWLLEKEFVPSGIFVVERIVNERSALMDRLLPDDRVRAPIQESDGEWAQQIVGDPVYFFAHPHRSFDRVDAEVWFKNTGVPIVELGVLAHAAGEIYDLKPLQNLVIDESPWTRLEQNGLVLLQRNPAYESIEAFLQDSPERNTIATYHYTIPEPYRLSDYQPSSQPQTIDVTLRGFHEFYTYLKNETFFFDMAFMDMNRKNGADPVSVVVIDEKGKPVGEVRALDDGNVSDDARPSALRDVKIEIPALPEGVYKIQLKAESDIFFRRLKTPQQKVTFLHNVYLGDEIAYREPSAAVSFWTEGKNMRFVTQHAEAVQTVQVGQKSVSISEPYLEYRLDVSEPGLVKAEIPRGDAIVRTDGHIAFSPEAWFNPDPVRLSANTDLDRLGVDFVIAAYDPPRQVGEWLVKTASFDTSLMSFDDDTWKFVISTPGIEDATGELFIHAINMEWLRPPLTWRKIIDEIKERLAL